MQIGWHGAPFVQAVHDARPQHRGGPACGQREQRRRALVVIVAIAALVLFILRALLRKERYTGRRA